MMQMWKVVLLLVIAVPSLTRAGDAPTTPPATTTPPGPHATTGGTQPGATSATRPEGSNELKPETEVKDIAKVLSGFFKFEKLENTVKSFWSKIGGDALDKVNKPEVAARDEKPIAEIMATVFATKDNTLVESMIPQIEELKKDAEKPVPPKQEVDKRRLELTKRLFWAAKLIDGQEVKSEEAKKFNDEFCKLGKDKDGKKTCESGAMKDALAKNADLLKVADDATGDGGDKPDRQADLLKRINHEALPNFLANAATSKNEAVKNLAAKIMQGLSTKDANGDRIAKFNGPNGEVPVNLGKTLDSAKKALADNAEKFTNWTFKSPAAAPAAPQVAANAPQTPASTASNRTPQDNTTPAPPPAATGVPDRATLQTFISNNCASCHGPGKKAVGLSVSSDPSKPIQGSGTNTFSFKGAADKMRTQASASAIAQLEAWAKAQAAVAKK